MNKHMISYVIPLLYLSIISGCQVTTPESPHVSQNLDSILEASRGLQPKETPFLYDEAKCKKVLVELPSEVVGFPVSFGKKTRERIVHDPQLNWEDANTVPGWEIEALDLEKCHFAGRFLREDHPTTFNIQSWKGKGDQVVAGILKTNDCPGKNCSYSMMILAYEKGKWESPTTSLFPKLSYQDFWPKLKQREFLEFPLMIPLEYSFSNKENMFILDLNTDSFSGKNKDRVLSLEKPLSLLLRWKEGRFQISPIPGS